MKKYYSVFVTVPNIKEAGSIRQAVLKSRLSACVSVVKGVRSFYWWKGRIESSNEILLIMKTTRHKFSLLKKTIKNMHSYEVPEITALPIEQGDSDYFNWINEVVEEK